MIDPPPNVTQFGRVPYAMVDSGAIASLRPSAARVYLVLLAHTDINWRARVGQRRLAGLAGVQNGTASSAVRELRSAGLIRFTNEGRGRAFSYEISTNPAFERPAPAEHFEHEAPSADRALERPAPAGRSKCKRPAHANESAQRPPSKTEHNRHACMHDASTNPNPVVAALEAQGVTPARAVQLAQVTPRLTVGAIESLASARASQLATARNPGGYFATLIANSAWRAEGADGGGGEGGGPVEVIGIPHVMPSDDEIMAAYGCEPDGQGGYRRVDGGGA